MTFIKTFFHKIGYGFGFGMGMTTAYCFVNSITCNTCNTEKNTKYNYKIGEKKFNTAREYPQI